MDIFSPWHLLIILIIVLALFGTKKLRNIGPDLGHAVREFKKALHADDSDKASAHGEETLKADPPPVQASESAEQPAAHDSTTSK